MSLWTYVAAALACGIGATIRYSLSRLRTSWIFPWPTLIANVTGSVLFGAIAQQALTADNPDMLLLVVGGGFAGGLTTFSSLAVDAVVLWHEHKRPAATAYVLTTFVAGLVSASAGWALASLV